MLAPGSKRLGFCPSCGGCRKSQTAAHLVDHVIPNAPVRRWVLSLPIPLRALPASQPGLAALVLQGVQRVVMHHPLFRWPVADSLHFGGGSCCVMQRPPTQKWSAR